MRSFISFIPKIVIVVMAIVSVSMIYGSNVAKLYDFEMKLFSFSVVVVTYIVKFH